MTDYAIQIDNSDRYGGVWATLPDGERLGPTQRPTRAAAKRMLERGDAAAGDTVTTWRGEVRCVTHIVRPPAFYAE